MAGAVTTTAITTQQARAAKRELARMRRSLTKWLTWRSMNDQVAAGQGAQLRSPILRRPGAQLPSPEMMVDRLCFRPQYETELAQRLYDLLSEVFDPQSLPDPDLTKNPTAAVDLAQIAISGQLPGQATAPAAQGSWTWPVVIVVGAIALVIMEVVRTQADAAAQAEQTQCIESGKCTDYGFWLKIGAIAFVGWLAWEKFGVRQMVTGKRRRRA